MRKPIRDIGASVRARLLNLAKERNQPFDLLLTRFAHERLIYRLSISPHRQRFVLKGAMLMTAWLEDPHRPTRDLDLLGFGDPDPDAVLAAFGEICAVAADDAVTFDAEGATIERIRADAQHDGLRIKTYAYVDGARVRVIVDSGFGDAIEPGLAETDLPALLDFPAPRLRSYVREACARR
jgi:Nucleotidyl transferase AbiEii toxin, Type IV TA system